jgi:hypothetical protein
MHLQQHRRALTLPISLEDPLLLQAQALAQAAVVAHGAVLALRMQQHRHHLAALGVAVSQVAVLAGTRISVAAVLAGTLAAVLAGTLVVVLAEVMMTMVMGAGYWKRRLVLLLLRIRSRLEQGCGVLCGSDVQTRIGQQTSQQVHSP